MVCPFCKRPLRNVGNGDWVCPIALEAQRIGIIHEKGRVHDRVLIYKDGMDPAEQVEWWRLKVLETELAKAVKRNIKVPWTSIENQADCGMFDLNGVRDHVEVWLELKCVSLMFDLADGRKLLALLRKSQKAWGVHRIKSGGRLFVLVDSGGEKLSLFAPGPLLMLLALHHHDIVPFVTGQHNAATWSRITDALFSQPNEVLFRAR